MTSFYNPVRVVFGPGSLASLPGFICDICKTTQKVLLLTRGGDFSHSPGSDDIMSLLTGMQVFSYGYPVSNPGLSDIFGVFEQCRRHGFDIVVAVGGGSVMDTGKILAATRGMDISSAGTLREMIMTGAYRANPCACRWIGIPTTAGTGSEVTPWATIWDRENLAKLSMDDPSLFSFAAIVDPRLAFTLPARLTVSTALDAICHAAEAYWSKKTNTLSRFYALEAIRTICAHLHHAVDRPESLEHRCRLAFGALYAGLAFSSTRTTANHSVSYPLTLMFGMEHGIAAAITLSRVMKLNEPALIEKEALFAAFNGSTDPGQVDHVIGGLFAAAGLPYRLSGYGVTAGQLDLIVRHGFTKGRMDNNPVAIGPETLLGVLKEIL